MPTRSHSPLGISAWSSYTLLKRVMAWGTEALFRQALLLSQGDHNWEESFQHRNLSPPRRWILGWLASSRSQKVSWNWLRKLSNRKSSHWNRGVANPIRTAKGIILPYNRNSLIIWNKQLNLPLQYLPPGTQESQSFVKQIGENLDYIITARFFRVADASRNSCLLENRWSLAQLLPSLGTGTSSQQRHDWAAVHWTGLACSGFRGGFLLNCGKVQFCQSHTLSLLSQ